MTSQETAWQAAESAAAALAPDADMFGSADAAGLSSSTAAVLRRAPGQTPATPARGSARVARGGAANPPARGSGAMRFGTGVAMAGPVAAARWMGMDAPPPVPVPDRDKRFA